MKPKASHRLLYGQGSFYYDTNRKVWRGVIEAGTDNNGKRRRFTVSSRSEDEAWRRLKQKMRDVEAGRTSLTTGDALTVKDWIEDWLDHRKNDVRPKTFATDRGQLAKWVIPAFGKIRARDLTAKHLRDLAKRMRENGTSTTTIRYTQALWQKAMKDARKEGYVIPNPFLMADKATVAVNDRDAIPLEDAIKLVTAAATMDMGTRWVAALLQGMRQGECLGLTWDAIDLDGGKLTISWQLQELQYTDRTTGTFLIPDGYEARQLYRRFHLVRPKSKAGYRVIPLIDPMVAALRRWKIIAPHSEWGLVWPAEDGGIRTPKVDRAEWKALQAAVGVAKPSGKPYVLHEARHTTATLLLAAGVDPEIIKAILGHSSIVTSRAYMSVQPGMKQDALNAVGGLLRLESGE
ncbi:site-specific integrase [Trueperella pyogenes]|uniref:tyrosine-type recombinase/integrase n=1 Tax=Trueperella pyogenes TaxID=1661 RepID=UPI00325090F1